MNDLMLPEFHEMKYFEDYGFFMLLPTSTWSSAIFSKMYSLETAVNWVLTISKLSKRLPTQDLFDSSLQVFLPIGLPFSRCREILFHVNNEVITLCDKVIYLTKKKCMVYLFLWAVGSVWICPETYSFSPIRFIRRNDIFQKPNFWYLWK